MWYVISNVIRSKKNTLIFLLKQYILYNAIDLNEFNLLIFLDELFKNNNFEITFYLCFGNIYQIFTIALHLPKAYKSIYKRMNTPH